jgi:hypothetical protein
MESFMRNLVLALLAGSSIGVAVPASAQYYPPVDGYRYGYGDYSGWGQAQTLERRIHNVLRSLGGVRPDQRYAIRSEAINLDRELRFAGRNGLNRYEYHALDVRIGQLERRVQWAAINRGYGYDRYDGYNGYYGDRDWHDRGRRWGGNDEDDGD